jgi:aquaporin Z
MRMFKRLGAEFIGTFWLVLGGCGSGLAAKFGVTPTAGHWLCRRIAGLRPDGADGAYALGHISGSHFNPAVSFGLWAGGRFAARDLLPSWRRWPAAFRRLHPDADRQRQWHLHGRSQCRGAFASNGYGALSPGGYSVAAAFLCEVVMTAMFLVVILGATHPRAPAGLPLAIGLALTLIHLISIPVTNTSVNPARSTGVALFAGAGALAAVAVLAGADPRWPARGYLHRLLDRD